MATGVTVGGLFAANRASVIKNEEIDLYGRDSRTTVSLGAGIPVLPTSYALLRPHRVL